MITRIRLLALILACGFAAFSRAEEELVSIQAGDLPIVISAPHGGTLEIPGVPPRLGEGLEKGSRGFVASREYFTSDTRGRDDRASWVRSAYRDILHRPATAADVNSWVAVLNGR